MSWPVCTKCGRERPDYIADPSCPEGGYCNWVEPEPHMPIITQADGCERAHVDRVAIALADMLHRKPVGMSQMALAVGLCNSLSCCLEAMDGQATTADHAAALLLLEEHLTAVVNLLGHRRRNRPRAKL